MKIIYLNRTYSNQILDILNDAIVNSTVLYDYKPRTMDNMVTWFDTKINNNFPVIGLVNEQDELMGFGSYGTFRAFPAYKYTVEHSLYVQKDHRGKGLGKILMSEIIKNAQAQDYHCLIAAIDSTNEVSIRLHKQFDFEFCGRIKQAGYKFGDWLNVDFYQLLLDTPTHPVES